MYLVESFFTCQSASLSQAEACYLLNQIIEQWRYNGQIIGREIPLFLAKQEQQAGFAIRVVCPEQHSLLPEHNNEAVQQAFAKAEQAGLHFDSLQIVADDLNSDSSHQGELPSWQLLYTSYLQSCSPLHSGEDLRPIPLYREFQQDLPISMDLIKWQENWQACDQLQMNGSVLEQQALGEISELNSNLSKHGYALASEIERQTKIPTYYYLYRVGGESLASEQQRLCPKCHGEWALNQPLFDIFAFKCDRCRLLSNLSWSWQ